MMLRPMIAIFFILFSSQSWAQFSEADSLQHLIRTLPNDTTKVFLLNKLVSTLRENDINKALQFGLEARQLSELIDYKNGKAVALENLGWVYYRRGDYTKAFELSSQALKIFESEGDESGRGRCIINIAGLRFEQKQYGAAIENFKTVFAISKKNKDYELMARCLNNIAFTFFTSKNADSALVYAKQALHYSEKNNSPYMVGAALRTLGDIALEKENYTEALERFDNAFELAKKAENIFLQVSILPRLATTYEKLDQANKAIEYLNQNIAIASAYGYKDKLEWSYKILSQLYASKNDIEKAFHFQSKYIAIHDSLNEQRSNDQLTLLQARFDSEMQEAKIALLTKDSQLKEDEILHQRWFIYLAIGCVALLIVLAVVLLNSNKVRKKVNESLASKNIEIQHQAQELSNLNITKDKLFSIISHDLRSPLASLRGLIDMMHSGDLSGEEFTAVSKKLKRSLDSVNYDLDNLLLWAQSQLRGLQVNPESLHLKPVIEEKINLFKEAANNKNITITNNVNENLIVFADKNHVSLVIRNLLTNAIKFNKHGGSVNVQQRENNGKVEISVEDSGVGMSLTDLKKLFNAETHFTNPGTNHEKGAGIGLLLTKEFIEKNGGAIWVNSELGKGSTFTFTLKRDVNTTNGVKIPDFKLVSSQSEI